MYMFIFSLPCAQLEAAETRIAELETCECRKPCLQIDERNNTMVKIDGSVWQHECDMCTCMVSITVVFITSVASYNIIGKHSNQNIRIFFVSSARSGRMFAHQMSAGRLQVPHAETWWMLRDLSE
jgi:hypothetical protein